MDEAVKLDGSEVVTTHSVDETIHLELSQVNIRSGEGEAAKESTSTRGRVSLSNPTSRGSAPHTTQGTPRETVRNGRSTSRWGNYYH